MYSRNDVSINIYVLATEIKAEINANKQCVIEWCLRRCSRVVRLTVTLNINGPNVSRYQCTCAKWQDKRTLVRVPLTPSSAA